MKKKKLWTLKQFCIGILSIFLIIITMIFFFFIIPYAWGIIGFNIIYSDGYRVGQIVKISDKGFIWKTAEVGMGLTQSGAYVQYWQFSIDSKNPNKQEIIDKLAQARDTGELVSVHYVQRAGPLYWRGKTTYLVDAVYFKGYPY